MICPKCEEGELKKIQFVPGNQLALLCDACEIVWVGSDFVAQSSGQPLSGYTSEDGYEYYIDIFDDPYQEQQPIAGRLIS